MPYCSLLIAQGIIAREAYRSFNYHGVDITEWYEESPGIAGASGQGGGVGDLTATYGPMLGNTMEIELSLPTVNYEWYDAVRFWGLLVFVEEKAPVQFSPNFDSIFTLPSPCVRITSWRTSPKNSATQSPSLREISSAHASECTARLVTGSIVYYLWRALISAILTYNGDGSLLESEIEVFFHFLNHRTYISIVGDSYAFYAAHTSNHTMSAADARTDERANLSSQLISRLMPCKTFTVLKNSDSLVKLSFIVSRQLELYLLSQQPRSFSILP